MNSKISLLLLLSVAAIAQAGLVAVPSVEVLQGPSSRTTLVGPDGSTINSEAPGGTVVTNGQAVVAAPALLAAAPETVVAGPAGRVITTYTAAGPAVVAAAPAAVAAPVAVAAAPALAAVVAAEDGQYIHDNTEQLYDDGAYRGE